MRPSCWMFMVRLPFSGSQTRRVVPGGTSGKIWLRSQSSFISGRVAATPLEVFEASISCMPAQFRRAFKRSDISNLILLNAGGARWDRPHGGTLSGPPNHACCAPAWRGMAAGGGSVQRATPPACATMSPGCWPLSGPGSSVYAAASRSGVCHAKWCPPQPLHASPCKALPLGRAPAQQACTWGAISMCTGGPAHA